MGPYLGDVFHDSSGRSYVVTKVEGDSFEAVNQSKNSDWGPERFCRQTGKWVCFAKHPEAIANPGIRDMWHLVDYTPTAGAQAPAVTVPFEEYL